jgi:predicted dehydrogenase
MSDTEWQIRNWYNFVWLSGDGLVEQAIHAADRIAWAMHDAPPISCFGVGGRAVPSPGGNIYDHFAITYQYPNGVQAFLGSRQIDGCYNDVSDYIVGSDGACTFGRGPFPVFEGKSKWTLKNQFGSVADSFTNNSGSIGARVKWHVEDAVYQYEQNALMSSIRNQKPVNDGDRMATSTMLAIMGRMAAYTGQQITWDQVFGSNERLVPEKIEWDAALPVAPRAEPGLTKFV